MILSRGPGGLLDGWSTNDAIKSQSLPPAHPNLQEMKNKNTLLLIILMHTETKPSGLLSIVSTERSPETLMAFYSVNA